MVQRIHVRKRQYTLVNYLKPEFLLLISILALLTQTQLVSAVELRNVVKEELVESQYGFLGDFFSIGDRIYKVTYEGGAQERVWKKTGISLSKATITETPTGMTTTQGQAANYFFKAQAPNLPRFTNGTGFAEHRFMMYDDTDAQQVLYEDIIDAQVPVAAPKQIYFGISNTLSVGKRFYFMKEFVKDQTTGAWVAGAESQSSEWRFEVNVLPAEQTPTITRTITVDTVPTNSTITVMDAVVGVTAKDFSLQTGQTKILVFKQEGYVPMMKGISSSTQTPFVVTLNKVEIVALTPAQTATPVGTGAVLPETPASEPSTVLDSMTEQIQEAVSLPGSSGTPGGSDAESNTSSVNATETVTKDMNIVASPEPKKAPNYTIFIIGAAFIIIVVIRYIAYTNLYVQKGRLKRKSGKASKKKGGMWFD